LKPQNKLVADFLLTVQSVAAVFIGIFLAAYLGGLFMNPSTTVLHSEPIFRIPLIVFGAALLILVLAGVSIAAFQKSQ
jgi:hypothetical protein